ncbi:MAG: tetratricopeptide repeat-containing sensor histidine kinase [Raineya sp.]|nr:tetratricopeptide repeat-containing sensor histidine kinase [Raineya sp.]
MRFGFIGFLLLGMIDLIAQPVPTHLEKKNFADIDNIAKKERETDRIIFPAAESQRCKILDSLESIEKVPLQKATILLEKIRYCIKETSEAKITFRRILFYLEQYTDNPCLEIYFKSNFIEHLALHHQNQLSYAKAELAKLKELTTQYACTNYEVYVLYLEHRLLRKEMKNDLALAKLIETLDFYKKNHLDEKSIWLKMIEELTSYYYQAEDYQEIIKILDPDLEEKFSKDYINRHLISLFNTLGMAYEKTKNYEKAERNFLKAIEIATQVKDSVWIGIPKGNLAPIYIEKGDYTTAEKLLEDYLQYALKYKELGIIISAYIKKATLYRLKKDFMKAERNLFLAQDFLQKHDKEFKTQNLWYYYRYKMRFYREYTEFCLATGNLNKVKEYFSLYDAMKDSMHRISTTERITDLETRYRIKQKEQENDLLKATNEQQKSEIRSNQILLWATITVIVLLSIIIFLLFRFWKKQKEYAKNLENLNLFKNKLFSVISHDLRNYMSSLKGYVYLVNNSTLTQNELKPLTEELAKNTEYTFGLLDNVLIWAKSQMQGQTLQLQKFEAKELVQKAIFEIGWYANQKQIRINTHFQENLWVEVDFNIFLIALRNIISNALKFSKNNGIIDIMVQKNNNKCDFIVKDYGTGIKPENLEKIRREISFNELGTSLEKGTGLGLLLTKSAIKDLKGSFSIESKLNEGTTVTISLPIVENKN